MKVGNGIGFVRLLLLMHCVHMRFQFIRVIKALGAEGAHKGFILKGQEGRGDIRRTSSWYSLRGSRSNSSDSEHVSGNAKGKDPGNVPRVLFMQSHKEQSASWSLLLNWED